ncbi:MAG: hypothetical protein AAGC46_20300 [Solirubrobacteraceae bacterium]|nr:hypothetical protein [Patulibacter sp.]
MRRVLLTSALLLLTGLAACGDGPTQEPSVGRPQLDPSGVPFNLAGGGSIDMPSTWTTTAGPAGGPELVRSTSGQGAIVVWKYPRTEPLPTTRKDLRNTRRSLRNAITTRDPTFKVTLALLKETPQPSVEIAGIGTMAGAKRSLRSMHVYANGAETVVDCIGPVGDAKAFTATICDPVIASLNLG